MPTPLTESDRQEVVRLLEKRIKELIARVEELEREVERQKERVRLIRSVKGLDKESDNE